MKKTLLFASLLALPLAALSQTNDSPPLPGDVATNPLGWVNMMIVALTPIVIAAIKWGLPKLPSVALPFIAPALGVALDQAAAFVSGHPANVLTGAMLGGLGTWLREAVDQSKKLATSAPAKAAPLILLSLAFFGCKSTLEPGGAYAPGTFAVITNASGVVQTNFVPSAAEDRALYEADLAYDLAYSAIDGAFKFEKENRTQLWSISPSIKHALDGIRPRAWQISLQWATARRAYLAHPTPAGLTTIQQLLAQLQQLADAASAVILTKQ